MVERFKRAVKPFYTDRCNVYESRPVNGCLTRFEKVLKFCDIECRASAKSYLFGERAGSDGGNTLTVAKKIKLFLPPEYDIKPGSEIEIIRGERKMLYGKSGEMTFYKSHNEVMVEILKDYA